MALGDIVLRKRKAKEQANVTFYTSLNTGVFRSLSIKFGSDIQFVLIVSVQNGKEMGAVVLFCV